MARFNHLLSEKKRRCKAVTPLPPGIKLAKELKRQKPTDYESMLKRIRIKYHWICEQVGGNIIRLNYVPTAEMTAK